jgi:hypothetical protein
MSNAYFHKGEYHPQDDRRCSCSYVKSPCQKCLEGYIRRKEREDSRDVQPFSIWPYAAVIALAVVFALIVIFTNGGKHG